MKFLPLVLLPIFLATAARAEIPIDATLLSSGYHQNFDSLPTADFTWIDGTTLSGWHAATSAGPANNAAKISDGTSNLNDLTIYSIGSGGGTERALTYHTRINTTTTYLGVGFVNQTGSDLTGFSLAYVAEQWRENTNGRTLTYEVSYHVGASPADLTAASGWTVIPSLSATTLDGAAGSRTSLDSGAVTAAVPAGSTVWFRWAMDNTATSGTSSHDILAIDDVDFLPAGVVDDAPPAITTQPLSQSLTEGETATFTAAASGHPAPTFQWFLGATPVGGATDATLVLTNVQLSQAGDYTVVATNPLGSDTSAAATLTVSPNTNPPVITDPPDSLTIAPGANASFSVTATGAGTLTYEWFHDGTIIPGADTSALGITGADETDAGNYTVTVTNAFGSATSPPALLTVAETPPEARFSLTGFGRNTTGGGEIPETDPGYVQVTTPYEFVTALDNDSGTIRVIEIMNDLDLGYLEVDQSVRDLGNFRQHAVAKLHPVLIASGVSRIDFQDQSDMTIFSANGATLRHATLNIKRCHNLIVRNLKFDEMWEWDEATKGDYDSNDWDFINLGNSGTVWDIWIDHCTFTKAYDGICDIKDGSHDITFSWCHYAGDDGATNPNSFVRQQIDALEASSASHEMYHFLRTRGFSVEDIVEIEQGHDKTHLIGANSLSAVNADHSVTFHHQWYQNPWDRLPRLRAGNVHNYNIYVDDEAGRQAKAMRDTRVAAMSPSDAAKLSSSGSYNFNVYLNGSISTEDGAILVEKSFYKDCLTPLRNNQTDPSNPVYTGKILGLDCITRMTDNAGVSTTVRGDSTDPGNPMGPFQAPVKPFSWNLPGGVLPYAATMDDPADLPGLLSAYAGAGKLTWDKSNWLKTSYAIEALAIVTQPSNQSAEPGDTVVFSVAAIGAAPLAYQWSKDGGVIPGATGQVLELTDVQVADSGNYTVTVTDTSGSVTSSPATLTVAVVTSTPAITTEPESATAAAGSSLTLSVAATGTAPLTYQWFKDGAALPGDTGPTLHLDVLSAASQGTYTVEVSNAHGSDTSAPAVITVVEVETGSIFVAPGGSPLGAGTVGDPTTLEQAIATVEPGSTILLRGGTYTFSSQITIARDNAGLGETLRKTIAAYTPPGGEPEVPVLDFSSQPYGSTSSVSNPRGIQISGHWWHLVGLEVVGSADNGIYVAGNHNVVERCITRGNRDTGLQIGRHSSSATDFSEWPADNLILNCESYDNYDAPPNSGENADGFACKLTTGNGNVFRGCIGHHNIDDGWDLFTKTDTGPIGPVVIDHCVAYANGSLTDGTTSSNGDRNGFKLGGSGIPVVHTVTRCAAFGNGKNGFTWNSNPAAIQLFNNLAFDNAQGNFKFDAAGPVFLNNISLYTAGSGQNDRYGGNSGAPTGDSNCFWYTGSSSRGPSINDQGIEVSAASFVTLALPPTGFAHHIDGSIDFAGFGRPLTDSPLIDAGTPPPPDVDLVYDPGIIHEGDPDIGLVETYLRAPVGDDIELLRYALGERDEAPGQIALPDLVMSPTSFGIRFKRLRPNVVYTIQTSDSMDAWEDTVTDPGQTGDLVTVCSPRNPASPGSFRRLVVTLRDP